MAILLGFKDAVEAPRAARVAPPATCSPAWSAHRTDAFPLSSSQTARVQRTVPAVTAGTGPDVNVISESGGALSAWDDGSFINRRKGSPTNTAGVFTICEARRYSGARS